MLVFLFLFFQYSTSEPPASSKFFIFPLGHQTMAEYEAELFFGSWALEVGFSKGGLSAILSNQNP